jgi:hypothetical protein
MTLYGASQKWPHENQPDPATGFPPAGSYIGLTMVPVSQPTAFNWLTNTTQGHTILMEKFTPALSRENLMRSNYPGLPALNGVERENMALVFYNGAAKACTTGSAQAQLTCRLTTNYYKALCLGGNGSNCNGGTWQWAPNPEGQPKGVTYVADVRAISIPS